LGRPKQLLMHQGRTLLGRAADIALASGCDPVVVVIAPGADEVARAVIDLPVTCVVNEAWQSGIGTSIRAGVSRVKQADCDAVVIMLCDQPLVTCKLIQQLTNGRGKAADAISACYYDDSLGVPALFGSALFDDLLSLPDTSGAKALILRHHDRVTKIPFPEAAVDIDTPDDLTFITLL